jgi:uncharacterized protein with ParB-like and HNH nuclease domain
MATTKKHEGKRESSQVVDDATDDPVVAPVQYDIASYGADYDVEGLVKRMRRGDITIPAFQRNYIWKQHEASRFVESLLLGLPVPGVFLAREPESNKLLVIDGQQRLKSLRFFYDGYFNPKENDKKKLVFKLIHVQKKFEGLTYETLNDNDRIKLNDSLIHATIVKQESPKNDDTSIYHIFDRLNSEGRRLTPQEIRTAIYHGRFVDLIKELNEFQPWREIYGPKSTRLKDQELILRFLAFYFNSDNYERPMNEFVNKFIQKHCMDRANSDFLERAQKVFMDTINVVWNSIGNRAFRPIGPLNAAVYDSVMVGIARRLDKKSIKDQDYPKIKKAYDELLADGEYLELVSQSTSDESNVKSRLKKTISQFNSI